MPVTISDQLFYTRRFFIMKTFMGLRGEALGKARIYMILLPAFFLFGLNQSNLGGCLAYPSFTKYFPTIDTETTKGATQAENAKIQGKCAIAAWDNNDSNNFQEPSLAFTPLDAD